MPLRQKRQVKRRMIGVGGEGQMRALKGKCPETIQPGALEKPQVLQWEVILRGVGQSGCVRVVSKGQILGSCVSELSN